MFRVIIALSISLLFMIQVQSAVSGVFTEIKKESREVKNDVSNTAGKIGSEVRRGVSTIGNNIKKDTKKTKKAITRSIRKSGKEIKKELEWLIFYAI